MPPQRSTAAATTSFNNRQPFKPPRPAGSASTSRPNAKGKAPAAAIDISSGDSDGGMASDDNMSDGLSAEKEQDDEGSQLSDTEDFRAFRKNPKSGGSKTTRPTTSRTENRRTSRADQLDDDLADGPPPIPQKLLVRLLHDGFEDPSTKIGKEAMAVVTKYIETFVRESIARAVLERQEAAEPGQPRSGANGFLQVEDLEKLGPQLILDF